MTLVRGLARGARGVMVDQQDGAVETPRGVSTATVNDYSAQYAYDLLDRVLTATDNGVGSSRRTHFCYDTAGDIRSGSTKRCGFAVGDGSLAVTCVHKLTAIRS